MILFYSNTLFEWFIVITVIHLYKKINIKMYVYLVAKKRNLVVQIKIEVVLFNIETLHCSTTKFIDDY